MKIQYIIRDVENDTYFLGSNPDPIFGRLNDGVRFFNTETEAADRLAEEHSLFGASKFDALIFEIIKVYHP